MLGYLGVVRPSRLASCAFVVFVASACGAEGGDDAGIARDAGRDTGVDAGPRCEPADGLPTPLVCNGHASLCDRPFDDVAYATTHNAMSSDADGWIPPNQGPAMWQQLEDGVRAMMLDTYEDDGETLLCHGICALGSRPFVDALHELRLFMDCHPAEVITLILEAHIDEARTAAAFEAAGLLPYLHAQPLGEPWPTLRSLIESGRRMVVFTESASVSLDWHHHAYTYAWDNDYANETPEDLDCAPNRGTGEESIFVLNHFLTAPVAMRSLAEQVNHDPFFTERVERCVAERGQAPNFVTVDFYELGDLFSVVDALNGL